MTLPTHERPDDAPLPRARRRPPLGTSKKVKLPPAVAQSREVARLQKALDATRAQVAALQAAVDGLAGSAGRVVRQAADGRLELPNAERVEVGIGELRIVLDATGIEIEGTGVVRIAGHTVRVEAVNVESTAGQMRIDAGTITASGVVKCDTLIANAVAASSYTPGAGNIW